MVRTENSWLLRRLRLRVARQWALVLNSVTSRNHSLSPELRDEAHDLHQVLSRLLQASDARMHHVRDSLSRMDLPAATDWRWRPNLMTAAIRTPDLVAPRDGSWLSDELALFHDCPERAVIVRQVRNRSATDLADYGLRLEVLGFAGSFLSFSVGIPADGLEDLGKNHVIRLDTHVQVERPVTAYARLNVQQGPNTETVLCKMSDANLGRGTERVVEFDLGYADLARRSVDKAWLDIIFEVPYMNAFTVRDVVLSRYTRAQI